MPRRNNKAGFQPLLCSGKPHRPAFAPLIPAQVYDAEVGVFPFAAERSQVQGSSGIRGIKRLVSH